MFGIEGQGSSYYNTTPLLYYVPSSLLVVFTDQINSEDEEVMTSTARPSETKSTPSVVTVVELDSTLEGSRILIGALLPIFSTVLLVILAVAIIVSTLWKARQKKNETNLQDSYNGLT